MSARRWWFITILFFSLCGFALPAMAAYDDPPHNRTNPYPVNCLDCHSIHSHNPNYPSLLKYLCESCHYPTGPAPAVKTHSSRTTDADYGDWEVDCWECHNPHTQEQNNAYGTTYGKYIRVDLNAEIKQIDPGAPGPYYPPLSILRTVTGTTVRFTSQAEFVDGDAETADDICQVCHVSTQYYNTGSEKDFHTDYGADSQTGGNCTTECHKHSTGFGPSCAGCHASVRNNNDGDPTRRAIVGEFGLSSHHVAGGAVTDDDCGVCHYEAVDEAYHKDNTVDLRDPDDGTASTLISFTRFERNPSSDTLESWVTDVQDNFCMKCHDSDGATATNYSGDPLQPFSAADRDVPDVYGRFDTANSFHHAVRGAGSNPYTIPSGSNGSNITMEVPWNQDSTGGPNSDGHDVISCFDCHGVPVVDPGGPDDGKVISIGHGSTNQRMIRTAVDFDTMETTTDPSNLPAGMGATVEAFCTTCHKASVYVSSSDPESVGSIFEYHGAGQNQHRAAGGNDLGCMGCHGGIVNFGDQPKNPPPTYWPNGAARGNIHGGSFDWSTTTSFASGPTDYFMLGGWIGGWQISGSSGECSGGDCNHGGTSKAGQDYTR